MCDDNKCHEGQCHGEHGDMECYCPAKGIIDVVSKKWTVCIVSMLDRQSPLRYNEIKTKLVHISPKSLSDTLKLLEREGLITRTVHPETPPRVEYALTAHGEGLKDALHSLVEWIRAREEPEG